MLILDVTSKGSIDRECLIWFAETPFCPAGYDVVTFKEARAEVSTDLFSPQPFATLFSDLRSSEDELFLKLSSGKRRDVRIARNRGWSISRGQSDVQIERFHVAHSSFVGSKGIGPAPTLPVLQRNAVHCLAAFVHDKGGKIICWNFYVLDRPIVRLWYAGSDLTYDKSDRGYAATLLHWEMMLYFKKQGFETYDWGGVLLDPTAPHYSITEFKMQFGGTLERRFEYYYRIPPSRGKRLWRRLLCRAEKYLSATPMIRGLREWIP